MERKIWSEKDIRGGMYVTRESATPGSDNHGFLMSVTFQIGYNLQLFYELNNPLQKTGKYTLNSVADGWSCGNVELLKEDLKTGYSKEALARHFNEDMYGYRNTTREEMHKIIDHTTKNFEI